MPNRTLAIAATAALALLGACTAVPDGGTRSGGEPPPIVLTIGTDDPQGRPASNQIEEFARQVGRLSDGAVRIEPRFRAVDEGSSQWDQKVARSVVAGDLDLGMIPARAWDTEGVTTLRALHTPLLVTTAPHMNEVVTDDDLSADLMAGLPEVGVTGLALVPEAIRHLLTVDGSSRVIARLSRGGTVRSPWSTTTWAFFEALGATPTDDASDRTMVAAESELALTSTIDEEGMVGNLPLFPKINSLVANTQTFDGLSDDQQDVLREAATATRDWAVDISPTDAELAASYCERGGTIVHDESADSEAVRDAARQVTEDLRQDSSTAGLIDRIAAAGRGVVAEPLPTCDAGRREVTEAVMLPRSGALPDGIYRVEYTDSYLKGWGLPREMILNNHGVWTITLNDGTWSVEQVAPDITDEFESSFEVRGQDAYWGLPGTDDLVCHTTWSTEDDGSLRFAVEEDCPSDARFHFSVPWKRIGGLTGTSEAVTPETIRPAGGDLPDGTYRAEYTEEFLRSRVRLTENVHSNHGVWTYQLRDGHWEFDQVAPDITDDDRGVYQVEGRHLYWLLSEGRVLHFIWRTDDDGNLHFEQIRDTEAVADPDYPYPDFQFALPWNRVP